MTSSRVSFTAPMNTQGERKVAARQAATVRVCEEVSRKAPEQELSFPELEAIQQNVVREFDALQEQSADVYGAVSMSAFRAVCLFTPAGQDFSDYTGTTAAYQSELASRLATELRGKLGLAAGVATGDAIQALVQLISHHDAVAAQAQVERATTRGTAVSAWQTLVQEAARKTQS